MAKSTIRNESAKTAFDVEKIKRFTEQELTKLASNSNDLPFCYQIGTDILVGKFKVSKINDHCWRLLNSNVQIFDFFTRKNAIFYCIAAHRNQYKLALQILESDNQLNRLEFDAALYRIRYKKAVKQADTWGEEFYSTQYEETIAKIVRVKQEIKKNLDLAKYIKV